MGKILERALNIAERVFMSLVPDEETARRLSKEYASKYNIHY